MCQSKIEKDEVFLNQNANEGNESTLTSIKGQLSNLNTFIITILSIIVLMLIYFLYKKYKQTHVNWMNDQLARGALQRLRDSVRRRTTPSEE